MLFRWWKGARTCRYRAPRRLLDATRSYTSSPRLQLEHDMVYWKSSRSILLTSQVSGYQQFAVAQDATAKHYDTGFKRNRQICCITFYRFLTGFGMKWTKLSSLYHVYVQHRSSILFFLFFKATKSKRVIQVTIIWIVNCCERFRSRPLILMAPGSTM